MPSSSLLLWLFELIYLVITPTNTETIDLNISQYKNKAIQCNSDEDCSINCYGYDSCAYSKIQCPINHECKVFCGDKSNACFNVVINATYSSLLELNGCSSGDLWTCSGITIYFPPKDLHGNKRSFINGDNNLNGHSKSLQFYAINGWSDIDSAGYIGSFAYFYGVMHCMYNYTKSCNFNTAAWLCESDDNLCDNPYAAPTQSVSKASAPKQIDILWYIVVTLSLCICGFSILLIYNMSRSCKRSKAKHDIHTDTEHQQRTSILIGIEKEESKDILKATMPQNPIQIVGDDLHNMFPLITYGPITSIASMTSIPSIPMDDNDIMEGPHVCGHGHSLNPDIITKCVNYSIQRQRMHLNMDENVNEMMDMMLDMDMEHMENMENMENMDKDRNHLEIEHTPHGPDDEVDEADQIPSVMFLYNSDMAIPEGRENNITSPTTPHLHQSFNISQSPSPTPTLSDHQDTNGLLNTVSTWPLPQQPPVTPAPPSSNLTISHASSATSNNSNSSSDREREREHDADASPTTTTVSNMTYMTASSIINSIISESNQSNGSGSYNDESEDNGLRIEAYDDTECIEEKTTVTTQQSSVVGADEESFSSQSTPVCSNNVDINAAKSEEQVYDEEEYEEYDEEDISTYRWRHNRNNSDTLIIDEDHDDTSSWISGEEEEEDFDASATVSGSGSGTVSGSGSGQLMEMEIEMEDDIDGDIEEDIHIHSVQLQFDHLKVSVDHGNTSNSNTEYDSSTSSMGEYFTNEVTEDEEESIEIGQ